MSEEYNWNLLSMAQCPKCGNNSMEYSGIDGRMACPTCRIYKTFGSAGYEFYYDEDGNFLKKVRPDLNYSIGRLASQIDEDKRVDIEAK